jgi:hypothetical protein
MKAPFTRTLIAILFLIALVLPAAAAGAQSDDPPTETPSSLPTDRPLVVIESYYLDQDTIQPGDSFTLYLKIHNEGGETAHNLIYTFSGADFLPQETGGVVALGTLGEGQSYEIKQRLAAGQELWGRLRGTVSVQLSYTDLNGLAYSESFTITLDVLGWSGVSSTATPTPTTTAVARPQLVISSYRTDVDPLQPGTLFTLELDIHNLGSSDASSTTMIIGGGGSNIDGGSTPQPGGVSGASGDTSIFAPIGSSNLIFLGDLAAGASTASSQKLVVNVTANPGAYALKLSFVYTDQRGIRLVDDQVITLLIYQLPQVEVNFYRDPGVIFTMQPNQIPVQVVNLGRKSFVFGNMTITTENAELMNNTILVGTLDAGGYFPLDAMLIPQQPGPLDLKVAINYTDDFNQSRTILQTLTLNVEEGAPPMDPGMNPGGPGIEPGAEGFPGGGEVIGGIETEETAWQKVLRFLRGLIGLDSAPAQPGGPGEFLPGEMPSDENPPARPAPGGKG